MADDYTVEAYLDADVAAAKVPEQVAHAVKIRDRAKDQGVTEETQPTPSLKRVGPVPISITCVVRRVIQPRQYESLEFSMSATCEVDTDMKLGEQLEKVHKLLVAKVDWSIATWTGGHPDGR